MADTAYLTDHFLIAMPALADPNFFHSVTYICEHSEQGAMGLVINQPLDVELGEVLEQMKLEAKDEAIRHRPVFLGGPVQPERGFVLHEPPGQWDSMLRVSDDLAVATSRDILAAISEGRGPERSLVALGYAGWGAGQLEQEVADNAWLTGPADREIIFNMPHERRWQAAAALLGVDMTHMSDEIGHA